MEEAVNGCNEQFHDYLSSRKGEQWTSQNQCKAYSRSHDSEMMARSGMKATAADRDRLIL